MQPQTDFFTFNSVLLRAIRFISRSLTLLTNKKSVPLRTPKRRGLKRTLAPVLALLLGFSQIGLTQANPPIDSWYPMPGFGSWIEGANYICKSLNYCNSAGVCLKFYAKTSTNVMSLNVRGDGTKDYAAVGRCAYIDPTDPEGKEYYHWQYMSSRTYLANKQDTTPQVCPIAGNPINTANGNKLLTQTDFVVNRPSPLQFKRYYNSRGGHVNTLGGLWTHNYQTTLHFNDTETVAVVTLHNNKVILFNLVSSQWVSRYFSQARLSGDSTTGWTVTLQNDRTLTFDSNRVLTQITHRNGNTETFTYDEDGLLNEVSDNINQHLIFDYDDSPNRRLITMTTSDGRVWGYRYDAKGNLQFVDNPDGTTREYHYEDSNNPFALTGITDERGIRYANYEYDVDGNAIASYHGPATAVTTDRIDGITVSYTFDAYGKTTATTVTNSNGHDTTYNFTNSLGAQVVSSVQGPGCSACGSSDSAYEYDANGNISAKTIKGLRTEYSNYDANRNPQIKTIAAGTPNARTINFTYDSRFFSKIATRSEPSVCAGQQKITTYGYDNFGNTLSVQVNGFKPDCSAISTATSYQYNGPLNQLSQIDGPRTDLNDIVYLTYYANTASEGNNRARLKQVRTDNGLVLYDNIQYSATGRVLSVTHPNGLQSVYTYLPGNDRLDTITETDGATSRTTRYSYLATGEVETVTTGDGSATPVTLTMSYDGARRLTGVTDGLGNAMTYSFDSEGNAQKENTTPPRATLKSPISRTFDAYNRLESISQENLSETYGYNNDGEVQNHTDGKQQKTAYTYDALKRLSTTTQDQNGTDPNTADAKTEFAYDAQDNLTQVVDPNNGTTSYQYDDLGNLLSQSSPDTGNETFSYDAAGNLRTQTDAKGQTFNFTYDSLNRLVLLDAPGVSDDVSYSYDTCTNGAGRVCSINQGGTAIDYRYNAFGDIVEHQGVTYAYDALGRVLSRTYPSGNAVNYTYDAIGNISAVEAVINGVPQTVATNIQYVPFGPIASLTYGNGANLSNTYDTAYRLTKRVVPGIYEYDNLQYDGNSNLSKATDTLTNITHQYFYDAHDRLFNDTTGTEPTQQIPPTQQAPVPVAAYDFEGDFTDSSGNGFDAITRNYGTIDYVSRDDNLAVKLKYSYGEVANFTPIQGATSYTISAWVNISYAYYNNVIANGPPWIDGYFSLSCTSLYCGVRNKAGMALIPYSQYHNTWQHWTGVYDNGTLTFYLNGQQVAQTTASSTPNATSTLYLGSAAGYYTLYNDMIDAVRIYDRALSPEEIQLVMTPPPQTSGAPILTPTDGLAYQYDKNGNRLALNNLVNNTTTGYSYESASNRMATLGATSVQLDANGNTLNDGKHSYTYNSHNRLLTVDTNINYQYNALGQRVAKTVDGTQTTFVYGTGGELLGEYQAGVPQAEHIYLNGQPLAVIQNNQLYYIHTDHLGTPRAISDSNQTKIWAWHNSDPFGANLANDDPDNNGIKFDYHPRFAGQYYDAESGLHYNYFRYYDPATGRYVTSDPIGLEGGLNTYGYVGGNPLYWTDPSGLNPLLALFGRRGALSTCGPGMWRCNAANNAARAALGLFALGMMPTAVDRGSDAIAGLWDIACNTSGDDKAIPEGWEKDFEPKWIPQISTLPQSTPAPPNGDDGDDGDDNASSDDKAFWNGLQRYRGKTRTSGRGKGKRYYEWDHTHKDVEVYNSRGEHLGSARPGSGEIYKPPVPGRVIDI